MMHKCITLGRPGKHSFLKNDFEVFLLILVYEEPLISILKLIAHKHVATVFKTDPSSFLTI